MKIEKMLELVCFKKISHEGIEKIQGGFSMCSENHRSLYPEGIEIHDNEIARDLVLTLYSALMEDILVSINDSKNEVTRRYDRGEFFTPNGHFMAGTFLTQVNEIFNNLIREYQAEDSDFADFSPVFIRGHEDTDQSSSDDIEEC